MKKIYILLAQGFELIEALAPYDVFCRGGINVKTVSTTGNKQVSASNGVTVLADQLFDETNFSDADLIYLPGGYPGYENLAKNTEVGKIVKEQYESGKFVAAICGAPTVLKANKLAIGKTITAHSSCVNELKNIYNYTGKNIEQDNNLLTAIGAGHSVDFAIKIAEIIAGNQAVEKIKKGMEL